MNGRFHRQYSGLGQRAWAAPMRKTLGSGADMGYE
jgi:hypothetical protein